MVSIMDTYEHLKERYIRAVITPTSNAKVSIEYLKTPSEKLADNNKLRFWQGRALMIFFYALIILISLILTVGALYGLFF